MNFDRDALKLGIEFAGVDHLLAASDYPHAIGSLELMKESIGGLDISEGDRAKIFGGNAAQVYGL